MKKINLDFATETKHIYVLPSKVLNALSIGKNIVFTKGILDYLSEEELKGAYYHELAHMKYKDQVSSLLIFLVFYIIGMPIWRYRIDIAGPYSFCSLIFLIWMRWQMELRADKYAYSQCGDCIIKTLTKIKDMPNRKPSILGAILHPPLELRIERLKELQKIKND